jgi:hypothetical protein
MLLLGLCKGVCAGVSYQQSGFTSQSPGNPCKLTAWLLPAARLNREPCRGHATARAFAKGCALACHISSQVSPARAPGSLKAHSMVTPGSTSEQGAMQGPCYC